MKRRSGPGPERMSFWGKTFPRCLLLCAVFLVGLLNIVLITGSLGAAHLRTRKPTPLFEDSKGGYLSDLVNNDGSYGFWDIEGDIPHRIKQAVLVTEDKRFYHHPGIDLHSILRSFWSNLQGHPVQGASTIPMQIARLQRPYARTIWHKLQEMYTGLFLVQRYGHEEVLRHYLKIIPQGNQMHGVAYAARRYFRKPLSDLSWGEAALLAAVLKAPGRMNLFTYAGFTHASQRATLILDLLHQEGRLSAQDHKVALRQLSRYNGFSKETRPENSYHYVLRLAEEYEEGSYRNYIRPVRTTLDPDLQEYLKDVAAYGMARNRWFGASNIAILVAEREGGEVRGYLGSADYFDAEHAGAINYATTLRSSGSTLKPFLYALGLQERHFTPASILADLPFSVLSPTGEYSPGNFDDEYLGPMLYRRALANSRNIPALRVLETIGLEKSYDFLRTLGLGDGAQSALYYGYGLAIGGLYVTLEQLVKAYGALGGDGKEFNFRWLQETPRVQGDQLMSTAAARQVTLFLSDTLARMPSFPRLDNLDFTFPVAVKTGTSQGYRDAWTVAYSSRYLVGIWMGHHENHRMDHVAGSVAAELVQRIFSYLQPEQTRGIQEVPFPPPEGAAAVRVCLYSGMLAGMDCTHQSLEYFTEADRPRQPCNLHHRFAINQATGLLADETTPPHLVTTRTYTVFPPEYATWAVKQGYTTPARAGELIPETSLKIVSPLAGTRLLIDPGTPRQFQTIPLQAEVQPAVREIVWYVDGREYKSSGYPYSVRWPLEAGVHVIQARFARANVYSEKIQVEINKF